MRYLVDANVWLERLLDQQRAAEADVFLNGILPAQLALTEFALYSIGIICLRQARASGYAALIRQIDDQGVRVIRLSPDELAENVLRFVDRYNLDFDDAYQYTAAKKHGLTLVSFDKDFDRTDRGRKAPGEIMSG